uniref:Uncharacterized protein n=1 Tax=Rhizophora mucronata TaxID=61149 RepID=A0A2P2KC09_RHIMU
MSQRELLQPIERNLFFLCFYLKTRRWVINNNNAGIETNFKSKSGCENHPFSCFASLESVLNIGKTYYKDVLFFVS